MSNSNGNSTDNYLTDPSASPEPEIEALEQVLEPLAYREELDLNRVSRWKGAVKPRSKSRAVIAVCASLALVASAIFLLLRFTDDATVDESDGRACASSGSEVSWAVRVETGQPVCGGESGADGRLVVGGWIETDQASSATVAVAEIGELTLAPRSRLGLVSTAPGQHRLVLERGRIHAKVDAPPRIFVVSTPAVEAIDLGCEYDLTVYDRGGSEIIVTEGAVALESGDRTVVVPAGFRARSFRDLGPAPAVSTRSSEHFREGVSGYFRTRRRVVLERVLREARSRDTRTLEGLLELTEEADCELVHARLLEISPFSFPWELTEYGCRDIAELIEAWRGVLRVEAE